MDNTVKAALVKTMREKFVATEFPRFMGYLKTALEGGKFLVGDDVTIADLCFWTKLKTF